jgi:hypothetical protein
MKVLIRKSFSKNFLRIFQIIILQHPLIYVLYPKD